MSVMTGTDKPESKAKKFTDEEILNISRAKSELINSLDFANAFKIKARKDGNVNPADDMMPMLAIDLAYCVVAGGCISSLLRKEAVNDFDVFILDSRRGILNSLIEDKSGAWTVRFVAGNQENKTYFDNPHVLMTAMNNLTRVQYILTDYTSRQDLISEFDFLHCTACYCPSDNHMYITHDAYDAIMNRKLVINNKKRPTKRYREHKFMNAGWRSIADSLLDDTKPGINWAFEKSAKITSKIPSIFGPVSGWTVKEIDDPELDAALNKILDVDPYLQTR